MKTLLLIFMVISFAYGGEGFLNTPFLELGETKISLGFIIKFLLLITVGFTIGWIYKYKFINSKVLSEKFGVSTKTLLGNLGYYFIIFITITVAFNSVGLNLSSLAVVAGALSVGIGFGLQNIVSNLISGIILMIEKSIKIGDYVELEAGIRGTVRDIKLRATTITTNEHVDIIVPNSNFVQNTVTNLTLNDEILRLRIPFGIAYGSDVKMAREVVLNEILADETLPHKKDDPLKLPRIWMVGMNASSLDFELVVFVEGEDAKKRNGMTSIYLIKIYEILTKHKISIPFPQMDVHIKEMPKQS
jgi:small-conductance mechanosensitive channel